MNNFNEAELELMLSQLKDKNDVPKWMEIVAQQIDTQPAVAEKILRKINEIIPEKPILIYNHALSLDRMGKYEEAESLYQDTIVLDLNDMDARNNYAILLKKQKRYPEAENQYRQIIERKPDYHYAYCNYANLLRDQGKTDEAEAMYKHALKLCSTYTDALQNYATMLDNAGRNIEASQYYKKLITHNPSLRQKLISRQIVFLLLSVIVAISILHVKSVPIVWGIILFIPIAAITCAILFLLLFIIRTIISGLMK